MGIVFRQSVKTTIVIFFGAVLGMIVVYVSTQFLSKEDLGFSRNLVNQGVIVQQFITLGIPFALTTFIPRYPNGDERKKVLFTIGCLAPVILSLVLILPYWLLKDTIISLYQEKDIPYMRKYYFLLPLLSIVWGLTNILNAYLESRMKIALSSFAREVLTRVWNIALLVVFIIGWFTFHEYILGMALLYLLPLAAMFYFAGKTEDYGFSLNWKAFSKAEYKELIHFSWYHLLMGISLYFLGIIDAVLLAPLGRGGMSDVAVYTNAVFFANLMTIPYRAIISATFVPLNRAYMDGEHTVNDLFRRSGINILIVGVAMFLLIGCNMHNAVLVFSKEGYAAMTPLALIIMSGRLFDMSTGLNNELISISKYYKFNFYIAILLIFLVTGLNYFMIPVWGMFGAAWGTTIALVIFNLVKMFFLWRKMNLHPFSIHTLIVLLIGLVTFAAGYYLPYIGNPFADAIVRSIVIMALYAGLTIWFKPSKDVNDYVKSVWEKKRFF